MVKTATMMKDGRVALVLGLSEANVQQLKFGRPIFFDPATLHIVPGTAIGGITVFYGADDAALASALEPFVGPTTELIVVPRGDGRPT